MYISLKLVGRGRCPSVRSNVALERHQMALMPAFHIVSRLSFKKMYFVRYHIFGRSYFLKRERKEVRSFPSWFYVEGQFEYPWLLGHTLYLVGSAWCSILWAIKTKCIIPFGFDAFQFRQSKSLRCRGSMTVLDLMLCNQGDNLQTLSLQLSLASINGIWTRWSLLSFLSRSKNLHLFVDRLKIWSVFRLATLSEDWGQQ